MLATGDAKQIIWQKFKRVCKNFDTEVTIYVTSFLNSLSTKGLSKEGL